jgi:hypothetical protein
MPSATVCKRPHPLFYLGLPNNRIRFICIDDVLAGEYYFITSILIRYHHLAVYNKHRSKFKENHIAEIVKEGDATMHHKVVLAWTKNV